MLSLKTSLKEKRNKKNLKCDVMVLKAIKNFYTFLLQRKKFHLDLNFRPRGRRPDHYCYVIELNLLYINYSFGAVVMNFGTLSHNKNNFNLYSGPKQRV